MFQMLDPRARLVWWLCISILAMSFRSIEATALLGIPMIISWLTAGKTKDLLLFTIRLIPFLIVISLVSLFPSFDFERAIRMALRFWVLLGATFLVMATTSYGELSNALRNISHPKLGFLEKPLEVFSLIFSLAFLTVPIAAEEWQSLKEAQRTRGVDLSSGNRLQQVRLGMEMLQPLLLRILERIKNFSIAVILYGYNPFKERTLYNQLFLKKTDKIVVFVISSITTISIVLAFIFKV